MPLQGPGLDAWVTIHSITSPRVSVRGHLAGVGGEAPVVDVACPRKLPAPRGAHMGNTHMVMGMAVQPGWG